MVLPWGGVGRLDPILGPCHPQRHSARAKGAARAEAERDRGQRLGKREKGGRGGESYC